MSTNAVTLLTPNSPIYEAERLAPFPSQPGERNKRGRVAVLAKVRRLFKGEVIDLTLGEGPTREWRVIKEALKQGIPLEIGSLEGRAEIKRKSLWKWLARYRDRYPILKLATTAFVDSDTFIVYFKPFKE